MTTDTLKGVKGVIRMVKEARLASLYASESVPICTTQRQALPFLWLESLRLRQLPITLEGGVHPANLNTNSLANLRAAQWTPLRWILSLALTK